MPPLGFCVLFVKILSINITSGLSHMQGPDHYMTKILHRMKSAPDVCPGFGCDS